MSASPVELWRHPDPSSTPMDKFRRYVNRQRGRNIQTFEELHNYSVDELSNFWEDIWNNLGVVHEGKYSSVVDESASTASVPDWFPGVKVSYAENILFSPDAQGKASTVGKEDSKVAVCSVREGATEKLSVTWKELRQRVGRLSQAMREVGVKKGDRIAGVVSNSLDTLVLWLATSTVGAVYSSSSTDMGTKGILDRLLQIQPVYLFMDDFAVYNKKTMDLRPKMTEISQGMDSVDVFRGIVSLPRFQEPADIVEIPRCQTLAQFQANASSDRLEFTRIGFREPFYICYSSGTTGMPKCIVHCAGGVVLSSKRELYLHKGMDSSSSYLQFTTTGWIMYMMAVNSLLVGAKTVLYDGSPFMPTPHAFIRLLETERVTHHGLSPRYFTELQQRNISPREVADLSNLRIVTCTGMVLSEALFHWFYDTGYPKTTQLANITGGTDLASGFAGGNPLTPVYVGECQGLVLGMKVEVFEQEDGEAIEGKAVPHGVPGELVCTKPFPTMPVTFFGKNGPKQYFESYFLKYKGVWTHGDFVQRNPQTGGLIMLGRADGVLNPSGVRFGSGEIYSVLESYFSSEISDSICVGQRRPQDSDESVILFLLMKPGVPFTSKLVAEIKSKIAQGLSKRHVPRYVFETPEIPTTINMKKVELPVKRIVSGQKIKPSATLANPECLKWYEKFANVEEVIREGRAKL